MGKGGQLYSVDGKQTFGGEHTIQMSNYNVAEVFYNVINQGS